jgi:hypothetical protein
MFGIARALRLIPEMMRHEFQRQRLARRPRQRLARDGNCPSLQIGEIRREGPQAIFTHAFAREVL